MKPCNCLKPIDMVTIFFLVRNFVKNEFCWMKNNAGQSFRMNVIYIKGRYNRERIVACKSISSYNARDWLKIKIEKKERKKSKQEPKKNSILWHFPWFLAPNGIHRKKSAPFMITFSIHHATSDRIELESSWKRQFRIFIHTIPWILMLCTWQAWLQLIILY